MDKEKILSALAGKLGKTSLSERTLEAYVSNAMPSEGEEPTEEWYTAAVGFLTSMQGQYNSDIAKFRREWDESHKHDDRHQDGAVDGRDDEAIKLINELRTSQEKLREELEKEVNGRRERERAVQLREYMQLKGATDDYVLGNVLKGAEIPLDKSLEDIAEMLLSKYDTELVKARGSSAIPRVGGAGGGNSQPSAAESYFAAKKRKMGKN